MTGVQTCALPISVAHAAIFGSVRLNAFTSERMKDAELRDMMKKVVCVADPVFSKGYPNQRASQVDIETTDGRKLSHFQPYRKGDPELPLTDDELNAKFMELAEPVLGDAGAKHLLAQLWALDKAPTAEFEIQRGSVRATA